MYRLRVKAHFDAAHRLENYKGKCSQIHGHRWKVEVFVKGKKPNETGLLIDFSILKSKLDKVVETLDHRYLNEIKESINRDLLSKLTNKIETQSKTVRDFSKIQTLILKAKLAMLEKNDFDSATRYLSNARELLSNLQKNAKYDLQEYYKKTINKIDELGNELKTGVYFPSNKFEEILTNLDILDKSR